MSFTLDSNILINMSRLYPRDIFGSVWDAIESVIQGGEVCICEAVLREVRRGGDDLHNWAKNTPGFLCAITDAELQIVADISNAHPEWVRGQLNEADPFVIAHAASEQSIVVTEETRKGPNTDDRNQKIPNISDEHDVECIKFFDFVRHYRWHF